MVRALQRGGARAIGDREVVERQRASGAARRRTQGPRVPMPYLWLDTVKQFSPTTGYVAHCRHTRNFLVCPILAETEPERCSLDVVAATTSSEQRLKSLP